jgi:predicted O-methyltransferase YrrM
MIRLIRGVLTTIHFAALRRKIHPPPAWLTESPHDTSHQTDRSGFHECYLRYVREVSRPDMAVSHECATFLDQLCNRFSFRKLLDLGSGFSSYTLRRYALNDSKVAVWSVDDDEHWIRKTKSFLRDERLSVDNLMMLNDFMRMQEHDFDLIFLDLNFVEVRKNFVTMALARCKPGGIIVFDDAHKPDFLYDVLRLTAKQDVTFFDVENLTRDEFGRYALLGIKNA